LKEVEQGDRKPKNNANSKKPRPPKRYNESEAQQESPVTQAPQQQHGQSNKTLVYKKVKKVEETDKQSSASG
jgi:hypothetical protein